MNFMVQKSGELKTFINNNYGQICGLTNYLISWHDPWEKEDMLVESVEDAVLKATNIILLLRTGTAGFICSDMTEEEVRDLIISEVHYVEDDEEEE